MKKNLSEGILSRLRESVSDDLTFVIDTMEQADYDAATILDEIRNYLGENEFNSVISRIASDYRDYNKFNEQEKLTEGEKFYNTEEHDVYIEIGEDGTTGVSVPELDNMTFKGFDKRGETVYLVLQDNNEPDTLYAYSVSVGFPYKFTSKLTKKDE